MAINFNQRNKTLRDVPVLSTKTGTTVLLGNYTYSIEEGDLCYDENGLVRFFSYIDSNFERREFVAYAKNNIRESDFEKGKAAFKSAANFVSDVIFFAKAATKGSELYHKYSTNEINGYDVVADASMWLLFRKLRSDLITLGVNVASSGLLKVFPKLNHRNDIVYYETQGSQLKIEKSLYV